MTDNLHSQTVQDLAIDYFNQGYTPIPIHHNDKKPIGKGWQNTEYENEAEVEAAFREHRGNIGLLMQPDQVCIDLDALNIANDRGLEILEAFGIPTDKNVIGRPTKICGGLFLKSNFPKYDDGRVKGRIDYSFDDPVFIKTNNNKSGIIETLHIGAQKLAEPSQFDGEKFTWTRPQGDLQFVDYKVIKSACNWIYVLSLLSQGYPNHSQIKGEGKRDKGMLRLAHVLSKAKVESSFASKFMNILAENVVDSERANKDWTEQIDQAKDEEFNIKSKFEHWNLADAAIKGIIEKLPIEIEEEDENIQTDFDFTCVADLSEAKVEKRDYAIKNLAQIGTYTQVHGTGGTGKTQIVITMAILATNTASYFCELFSFEREIKTLYISNEDSTAELERRFLCVLRGLKEHDMNNKDLNFDTSKVHFKSYAHKPLRLATKTQQGKMKLIKENVAGLTSKIKKGGYHLVILDPIVSFHAGEENSNMEMDFFIRNAVIAIGIDCNCAIIGVHHTSKGGSGNSSDIEDNTNASRGASAFTNAARSVIKIAPMGLEWAKKIFPEYRKDFSILDRRFDYCQIASGKRNTSRPTEGNWLYKAVVKFQNKDGDWIDSIVPLRDASIEEAAKDAEKRRKEETEERKRKVISTLDRLGLIEKYKDEVVHYFFLTDIARELKEHNDDYVKDISAEDVSTKTGAEDYRKSEQALASHLKGIFQTKITYKEKDFVFVNKKRGSGNKKWWLEMTDQEVDVALKAKEQK